MKNNYFPKKLEWSCFYFSNLSALVEESWILMYVSVFSLLQYIVLIEVCLKKSGLTQICR